MGFYLPSEVSRLVLSYLLDHDLQDTSVQFLEECPFLQELRQVPQEELSEYTRVNGRSLMEILREYKGLIKTISGEYKQINPGNNFEAPQRMLDLILEKRKASSQAEKSVKKLQPIRPKPPPTPGIPSEHNVRKPLRSCQPGGGSRVSPITPRVPQVPTTPGMPHTSTAPIHNITINLPPVEPTAKTPIKKIGATSGAAESPNPKNLVINTEENNVTEENSQDDIPDQEDEEPVSSTSKPKSSTNSLGKAGSRKGKRPVRRGTLEKSNEQTDDEFLAELLGKPIAEMLGQSVMMTKGQDQQKAISDVAHNMLTPSLLDKLVDVVDLDQLPRPKGSASPPDSGDIDPENESGLSTPELCAEEIEEEASQDIANTTILPSLPQTPLPRSELAESSSLSCVPPVFLMSPLHSAGTSSSSAPISSVTTSQSATSSTPSSLVFLQSSADNTITLTPGTAQYEQFAAALYKIPSLDPKARVIPSLDPTTTPASTKQEDPLSKLISATITNSPTKAPQAMAELDLTNVPIDIVGGPPAQTSRKPAAKTRKRKITTPKHLGAGKKSKAGNEVTEEKATSARANPNDKQILDKFQIQLQAVIGGAAKPVASKSSKTTSFCEANNSSMLEKVATLSKTKGPLGKENVTVSPPKCLSEPKMLVLTPITREEIQAKELAKRKSQLASKKDKSARPMAPSPHIRNLIFSPPKSESPHKTPEKNIKAAGNVKILSPLPAASPLRRTDSSWNREIKIMFQEQSPRKENDPNIPLPTSPLPLSEISLTPTMTSQPSVESLTKSLESPHTSAVTTLVSSTPCVKSQALVSSTPCVKSTVSQVLPLPSLNVSQVTPCVSSNETQKTSISQVSPAMRKSSPAQIPQLMATPSPATAQAAEPTLQVSIPRKIMIPITMPAALQPTTPTTAKDETSIKKLDKKRPVSSSKKDKSPQLKPSWDERMRMSLGAAETNMDHIAKRYSESSPGRRRRSPRKKRKHKSSPSNVFSEEEDDSPPEIQLEDGQNITPESQKLIEFIGTSLLESLELNEGEGDSSDSEEDEDDNLIENEVAPTKRKAAGNNVSLTDMPILANSPNKSLHKQATKTLNRAIASMVATKKKTSPLKKKPPKNVNKNEESIETPDMKLEPAENVTEICQSEPVLEDSGKSDSDLLTHTIKPETTIELLSQPVVSPDPDDAKFKTPKKADAFTFKTPHKSPRLPRYEESPRKTSARKLGLSPDKTGSPRTPRSTRAPHIPVSPFNLLSPVGGKRAVPLTPSRSTKKREESCLDTPVLQSPGPSPGPSYAPPTTPRGNKTPSAPYYTPSPSTRDSFHSPGARPGNTTPGLKFLLEEGQKLSSQSEDSMSCSPAKAKAAGKSCRKSFRNMFKKSSAEGELGSLLEKQISKYSFDQQENNYATFKSPDTGGQRSDYTCSPHIVLRPSSTQASPLQAAATDGNASFVSPNRTCYLSPTAMAMSSSFLGLDYNTPPEAVFSRSESSQVQPASSVEEATAQPTAVMEEASNALSSILELADPGEDLPKTAGGPGVQSGDIANLSDTEQSADFSKMNKLCPTEEKDEIDFPDLHLSEDSNSGDDEGEGTSNISEINRRGNTFIEAFQEVKKKEKDSVVKEEQQKIDAKNQKPTVKWSPRKPRRLTLTALKSSERLQTLSLTNDSSPFEAQFDIHNLDKVQTSVQNYSEDTSSSMDSQFESPLKTSPKKKSPKKVPSPKLTVKITSKIMEEKRKSAEKIRKRIAKEVKIESKGDNKKAGVEKETKEIRGKSDGKLRKDKERIVKDKKAKVGKNVKKLDILTTLKSTERLETLSLTNDSSSFEAQFDIRNYGNVEKLDEIAKVKAAENRETKKELLGEKTCENIKQEKREVADKITTRKTNKNSEKVDAKKSDDKESKATRGNMKKTEEVSDAKNVNDRRGRSLDRGDEKLSLRPRRGNSFDNQSQEVAKKATNEATKKTSNEATKKATIPTKHVSKQTTEPKSVTNKSSTAKTEDNITTSHKTRGNKNPPSKFAEENLVKLNQELTLQFSPRKSSPVCPEAASMDLHSDDTDFPLALGLIRNKRKAEDSPDLPEKKAKVMRSSEELTGIDKIVKNTRDNKQGREITPKEGKEINPKQGREITPTRGKEINPKQGREITPTRGKEINPKQGREITPKEGKEITTKQGREITPKEGKEITPKQGREITPTRGKEITPKQGKEIIPKKGTQITPKQGRKITPKQGKEITPNQGTEITPKRGQEITPKQGRKITPKQGKEFTPKGGREVPPILLPSPIITTGASTSNIRTSLSPNVGVGSPSKTRKALASYSPKKARKDESPQEQNKDSLPRKLLEDLLPISQCDLPIKGMSPDQSKEVNRKQSAKDIAHKKPDLITKQTDGFHKEVKNLEETCLSPERVAALAQSAMEIMSRINQVGKKASLVDNESNKHDKASNVHVDNMPGDSVREDGGQENESPECTLQDDSYSELSMSEVFIFQTNLPFGVFEEELE